MIEPTIYLLIAIADYAGIKDYTLYQGEEEDDPDTEIPDDNIQPVDMDGDDKVDEEQELRTEPDSSSVDSSLLSKIKKELPSKVKEATQGEE